MPRQLDSKPSVETLQSAGRLTPTEGGRAKYQLWPAIKRPAIPGPNGRMTPDLEKTMATNQSMPYLPRLASEESLLNKLRKRGESLPRRRKISVPELGLAPMTTVQEKAVDSRMALPHSQALTSILRH